MAFAREADFEAALIQLLSEKGWEKEVLHSSTEQQLVRNWADILEKAKASTVQEAIADPKKSKVYYDYMAKPLA